MPPKKNNRPARLFACLLAGLFASLSGGLPVVQAADHGAEKHAAPAAKPPSIVPPLPGKEPAKDGAAAKEGAKDVPQTREAVNSAMREADVQLLQKYSSPRTISVQSTTHVVPGHAAHAYKPRPKPRPKPKAAAHGSAGHADAHGATPAHEQHAHIHWSYEGEGAPDKWAALEPKNAVCGIGNRQSPIDIRERENIKVDLEPIQFDYQPSYFRIVDNGHTIQVALGAGSITVTGKTYNLLQFHFHRPSEEKVNGRPFDMVAHLVHKSDDGKLAVVAVLMEKGSMNPFIQTVWNNLPLEKNVELSPPNDALDLNTFLPASQGYYTYMGSLTTPPCTEGVLWLVLKQPVQLSQEQINIFARLYRNNARPVQATGGRLIKESR